MRRSSLRLGLPIALALVMLAANPVHGQDRADPLLLNHPTVIDTAHLKSGDTTVSLFGVKGEGGALAEGLQAFVTANGDRVTCHPHSAGGYVCIVPTGLDVAATALANGAAETIADSSADYREQQAAAQGAQLGVWAALPPGPVSVQHPVVQTTAEIDSDGRVFLLAGLVGFPAQYYTMQLQAFITAHGDRLSCQVRSDGTAVCLLPDGTDVATVALEKGLARATPDAPAAYRAAQAKAMATRSGFWFDPPQAVLAALPSEPVQPCCVLDPNDTLDPLNYADGIPTAVVDGAPAFFLYSGLLGWGFFDVERRWHPAPAAVRDHLERFHPEGRGLRLPSPAGLPQSIAAFRAPGPYGTANFHGPLVFRGPQPATQPIAGLPPVAPLHQMDAARIAPPAFRGFPAPGGGIRPAGVAPGGSLAGLQPRFAPVPFRPLFNPARAGLVPRAALPRVAAPAFRPIGPLPGIVGRR